MRQTICDDTDFYQQIGTQSQFLDALNPGSHVTLPATWWVVIADIENSTHAIETGSYKNVNTVGVACITALVNVNRDMMFPFLFGGDGVTAAIPEDMLRSAIQALRASQQLSQESFGLHLRVGLIKAADLYAQGFSLSVGKVRVSKHVEQPVFSGDGWHEAERAVKSKGLHVLWVTPNEGEAEASFEGFECRWQGVPSAYDHKLSLIVSATSRDTQEAHAVYQDVLKQIKKIYGDVKAYHPLQAERMQLTFNIKLLSHEWRVRTWGLGALKQGVYFLKILLQNVAGYWLFKRQVDTDAVQWSQYRNELAANSDYQKFDGMLRMVIDGKNAQANALEHYLQDGFEQGRLVYGMHQSQEALVTCIVNSHAGNHLHFVDGGGGGYALAAKALKARLSLSKDVVRI